jgi:catechol 2,3-dioxygenase-like lactoylglutathione lyase family enzyme
MNSRPDFACEAMITKFSSSDITASSSFYTDILGFQVDPHYTINAGGNYGAYSYVQFNGPHGSRIVIGLFKDIDRPFPEPGLDSPPAGTAPTFLVPDIDAARAYLANAGVPTGKNIKSVSDAGYTDIIFLFVDPDNNLLVARMNV